MTTHFSTIGLPLDTESEMIAFIEKVSEDAELVGGPWGSYLRWEAGDGTELWIQADTEDDLVGLAPHFTGKGRVRAGVNVRFRRPGESDLDGSLHAWAEPEDERCEDGAYPFVFDCPDVRTHDRRTLPWIGALQVAAFAHELMYEPSEAAWEARREAEGTVFAARSFLPAGLFDPEGNAEKDPTAHAILTGIVLEAELRKNPATGDSYWWALVESFAGTYDVVIDPSLVTVPIAAGGVVSGMFWLSGRLILGNESA